MKKIYAFLLLTIYVSCFILPLQAEVDTCVHHNTSYISGYPGTDNDSPCSTSCNKLKTCVDDEHFSHYTQHPAKAHAVKYCKSFSHLSLIGCSSNNVSTPSYVWRTNLPVAKVPLHILHCSFLI